MERRITIVSDSQLVNGRNFWFRPLAVSSQLWAQADVIGRAKVFEALGEVRASCQRHFAPIST
jgi:hypothetical protein